MTTYSKEYYEKYKESIIKAVVKYKAKNKDKVRVWQARTRANKKAVPVEVQQ